MRDKDVYKGTKLMSFRVRECEHEAFKKIVRESGYNMNGLMRKFVKDYINLYNKEIL